jgi:hypothetical protein
MPSGIQENIVSEPRMLRASKESMSGLRGMIHFSERARTLVCSASSRATNSSASTADAPPPIMATFLPFALLPSS